MASIKLSVEVSQKDLEKYVRKNVEGSEKLQPVVVGCTDDFAKLVEFGTDNGGKRFAAKDPPESFKKWAGNTYNLSGDARNRKARQEYYKFQKLGMPPMPFMRPALHSVLRRISSQRDWLNHEGNDTLEIANLIAEEMKRIVKENNIPMADEIIEKIFFGQGDGVRMSSYIQSAPPEVLASDDMSLTGGRKSTKKGV